MSSNYPAKRNNSPDASEEDVQQDMSVINQPSGVIEFNNKKGHETLIMQFHDGSFKKFSNHGTDELNRGAHRTITTGQTWHTHKDTVTIINEKGTETINFGDSTEKCGDVDGWMKPVNDHKNLLADVHDEKRTFEVMRTKAHNDIDQSSLQEKDGTLADCPLEELIISTIVSEPSVYTRGQSGCSSAQAPSLEIGETTYEDLAGGGGLRFDDGWYCLNCWGSGESPSSQDGDWTKESVKDKIESHMKDLVKPLAEKEKEIGQSKTPSGGNKDSIVSANKFETVGLAFNDYIPYRVDPKGKHVPYGIKIDPFGKGVYPQYRETSLVEIVHTDSPIGGDYVQTIGNKWTVNVGANGIDIKTIGRMNMFSPIMTMIAKDLTIYSSGEVSIGGERVDIEGEVITLRPKSVSRTIEDATGADRDLDANGKTETETERQVLVDGNLNVEQNLIVKGGTHVEGELSFQHMTAPLEWHVTEDDFELDEGDCDDTISSPTEGDMKPGYTIGYVIISSGSSAGTYSVISTCATDCIAVHRHHHYYAAPAMKLVTGANDVSITVGDLTQDTTLDYPNEVVRAIGARCNFDYPATALPIMDSEGSPKTTYTKFGGWEGCDTLEIDNGVLGGTTTQKTPKPEGMGVGTAMEDDLSAKKKEIDDYFEEKFKDYTKKLKLLENGKVGYEE